MSTKVLAKAILQAEDGTILLLKRSETDTRRPLQWDFPGGGVDDSEDFVAAAIREIKEEMGLDIKIVEELGLTSYNTPINANAN